MLYALAQFQRRHINCNVRFEHVTQDEVLLDAMNSTEWKSTKGSGNSVAMDWITSMSSLKPWP
eukprot:scaffold2744_cov136-Cylindrotheca_fusiformis.AAC.24